MLVTDSRIAALSDHESSESEDVPSRVEEKQPVAKSAPKDDEDEDDADSEVAEDEYAHAGIPYVASR